MHTQAFFTLLIELTLGHLRYSTWEPRKVTRLPLTRALNPVPFQPVNPYLASTLEVRGAQIDIIS